MRTDSKGLHFRLWPSNSSATIGLLRWVLPLSLIIGCGLIVLATIPVATAARSALSQVPFQTVAKSHRSGIGAFTATVVRSTGEWAALWKKHAASDADSPPPAAIDFSNETVAGVFLGERPTGGYDVEIVRIEKDPAGLTVSFVEKRPPAGAIVTQALTQPFHIVRFAVQGSGTIAFRRVP